MLKSIPSKLLSEWHAYYNLEPFGEWRGDYRAGMIASVLAEIHRDKKKRKRPFTVDDFMPRFGRRKKQQASPRKQTVEEQRNVLMAIAAAFGVKKKDKKDKGAK